jgi:hypothetical protein
VLITIAEPFISWFRARSILYQLAFVLIIALLVTLCGLAIDHMVLRNFVVPDAWIDRYKEIAVATGEEDPFTLFNARDSYLFGGYLLGFGLAGIMLLRDAVPEIGTIFGKALNVCLGLALYYGFGSVYGVFAGIVRGTLFYDPYLMLAFAILPLLIYVVTPTVTARILSVVKRKEKTDHDADGGNSTV